MATIVQFPSGKPIAQRLPVAPKPKPTAATVPYAVSPIRKRLRVPKRNRPQDDRTVMIARMAKSYRDKASALAQTEPDSEKHRFAAHMATMSSELPCNNLRLFTTPEDVLTGVWMLWRKVGIACLEWELCDARRLNAFHEGDDSARNYWTAKTCEAEKKAWLEYERLVRVPAASLTDFKRYKLDRRFRNRMGDIDWMRRQRPELALILDEELALLTAAKDARKARRQQQEA